MWRYGRLGFSEMRAIDKSINTDTGGILFASAITRPILHARVPGAENAGLKNGGANSCRTAFSSRVQSVIFRSCAFHTRSHVGGRAAASSCTSRIENHRRAWSIDLSIQYLGDGGTVPRECVVGAGRTGPGRAGRSSSGRRMLYNLADISRYARSHRLRRHRLLRAVVATNGRTDRRRTHAQRRRTE